MNDVAYLFTCLLAICMSSLEKYLSSAFSKSSLYIWKFLVHILLKPNLKDYVSYFILNVIGMFENFILQFKESLADILRMD